MKACYHCVFHITPYDPVSLVPLRIITYHSVFHILFFQNATDQLPEQVCVCVCVCACVVCLCFTVFSVCRVFYFLFFQNAADKLPEQVCVCFTVFSVSCVLFSFSHASSFFLPHFRCPIKGEEEKGMWFLTYILVC